MSVRHFSIYFQCKKIFDISIYFQCKKIFDIGNSLQICKILVGVKKHHPFFYRCHFDTLQFFPISNFFQKLEIFIGWATPELSRVFWKEFPWKFFPEKNGNFWNFHFFPKLEIFGNGNFWKKWKKFTVPF